MRTDVTPRAFTSVIDHVRAAVLMAALTLAGATSAESYADYFGCADAGPCDQISVRASSLRAGRRLQVDVPVPSCAMSGGAAGYAQDIAASCGWLELHHR